ncbi:hypothetical protein N0V90_009072 [Kalmusia sp. IMI 367209]|nr:hypothetical protein N0V90_009072 [Kalmusia sp. IMI 367209]
MNVEADVFGIMDCCYASDLLRNVPEYGRTFEMLAASPMGTTTPQPGENSFTRSLIKYLRIFAEESTNSFFTTRDILERMQKERGNQAPALWHRIPGISGHIRLNKLRPLHERPKHNSGFYTHERYLHLGFALKKDAFHELHIEQLTKELPQLFHRIGAPLAHIKWLGCRKVGTPDLRELVGYIIENKDKLPPTISPLKRKRSAPQRSPEGTTVEVSGSLRMHKVQKASSVKCRK